MKLPQGAATGIGSLPGTDIRAALRTVLDELPDLPHLPELPARGPGADLLGRSAGLLVALPVELHVGRWRLTSHRGMDGRRTADLWERDLDALTDEAEGYRGPLKVQVGGPWTLAASLELPVGGRILRDPGAVRELAASLGEGIAQHVRDVTARVPGAEVIVQLDEPSLPAVLAGHVPTESGFSVLAAVEPGTARDLLHQVIEAAGTPVVVHCCDAAAPLGLLRDSGATGIALDLDLVKDLDPLGEALDAGVWLFAGVVPTAGDRDPASATAATKVTELWRRLGFPVSALADLVAVTPACGLAGATPDYARAAMKAAREAGRRLLDEAMG
jgi:methionine synthase II (cobalamin-independent)